jgi:hypothetical protein
MHAAHLRSPDADTADSHPPKTGGAMSPRQLDEAARGGDPIDLSVALRMVLSLQGIERAALS